MLQSIGIVALGLLVIWREASALYKMNYIRELVTVVVLSLIAMTLGVMQSLRLPIPNPTDIIIFIFQPISDWLLSFLD